MFKTEHMYVSGKGRYFRLVVPEAYQDETYWKLTLYPNTESLEKLRDLQARGIKNVMKKDDEGSYFMQFRRPTEKKKKAGGKIIFDPPKVLQKLGDDIVPLDGRTLGNGSDITVKLEIYGNPLGPRKYLAARLESVLVNHLVPYEPTRDIDIETAKEIEGFDNQPDQLF